MRLLFILIILSAVCLPGFSQQTSPLYIPPNQQINPTTVVVKIQHSHLSYRVADGAASPLSAIQQHAKIRSIEPFVPPMLKNARAASDASGLDRIYIIELEGSEDVLETAKKFSRVDGVEYAEPLYENAILRIPNDPHAQPESGNQYYLSNINAYQAWDIEMGNDSIVIGVVDTGVDTDHADLFPSIAINSADPVNGMDDDGDGYVDNYLGWDFGDNDNDPNTDVNNHGNIVTGVSSAKADNGIGLAGVGFNSRFMPIKVLENTTNKLKNEYFGVLYAAYKDCKVINLSWGGAWNYSRFGQDVIDYVVNTKDAVVVAAAGNTHGEIDFYPASFNNVLSVTSSGPTDAFSTWATFSHHVDIMAPGESIYSANSSGGYSNGGNGTSYAAPMVAGAAALVRRRFPDLNAIQVMEQLRVTADDVYDVGNNNEFYGKLGKGRLNIAKALTEVSSPSVRVSDFNYSGKYDEHIFPGDTLLITTSFTNYLAKVENISLELKSADENTAFEPHEFYLPSLNIYQKIVPQDTIQVIVGDDVLPNSRLHFQWSIEADNYSDFEFKSIYTTPWFFDVENADLALTIASDGDLGYDRDSLLWGNGFWKDANKLADYMGIILSRSNNFLIDNVVNNYSLQSRNQAFEVVKHARLYTDAQASVDARSVFREKDNPNGFTIEQKILGWNDLPDNDFFVVEYRIVNASDSALDSLNFALYSDWDIQGKSANRLQYDPNTGIAYAFNLNHNNLYAGMAMLTAGDTSFCALDLTSANGHSADFSNVFTDSLKMATAGSNFEKIQAGHLPGGNNIASLMGLRNVALAAGEHKKIAFVLMATESPGKLEELRSRARSYYQEYQQTPPYLTTFPICAGETAEIQMEDDVPFEIYSDPLLGDLLDSGQVFITGELWYDSTFYISRIINGFREDVRRVHVHVKEPIAAFTAYTDTLLISPQTLDTITFSSTTKDIDSYFWDFGNGYYSTVANPKVQYEQAGEYLVKLAVQNAIGCSDSTEKWLFVAERSATPQMSGQVICKGEQAVLAAENTSSIKVYASPMLQNTLYSGEAYATGVLHATTTYYVTNMDGFESLPTKVEIMVSHPELSYQHTVDTTALSTRYALLLENTSQFADELSWEVDGVNIDGGIYRLNYEDVSEIHVRIFGADSLGCRDTLFHSIKPAISPATEISDMEICVGGTVKIKPDNGTIFFFYSDGGLSHPIHKGTALTVGPIRNDTSFFITNVDSLLEGSPAEVHISLKPLKAVIGMTPDSLNLNRESSVLLEDLSAGASQSHWILPNSTIDTRSNFEIAISEAGTYTFALVAKDEGSCIDTAYSTLNAYLISGFGGSEDSKIRIFPNPANEKLNIYALETGITKIELLDQSGKLLLSQHYHDNDRRQTTINLSIIPNGIYLLKIHVKDKVFVEKVVVGR